MNFELLNRNRIKVTVSAREQEEYGVSYETMDYSDKNTRALCEKIIDEAGKEMGFYIDDGKLLVEARQCVNGNVAMYLSRIPCDSESLSAYDGSVKFENSGDMIDSLKIFSRFYKCISESKLYLYEDQYYIYFKMFGNKTDADELWFSLLEYGEKTNKSKIFLEEYAENISENLIKKIYSVNEL